jgi:hypothetical protein
LHDILGDKVMPKFTLTLNDDLREALLDTTTGRRAGVEEVLRNSIKWVLLEDAIYEEGGCFYIREEAGAPLVRILPLYDENIRK